MSKGLAHEAKSQPPHWLMTGLPTAFGQPWWGAAIAILREQAQHAKEHGNWVAFKRAIDVRRDDWRWGYLPGFVMGGLYWWFAG